MDKGGTITLMLKQMMNGILRDTLHAISATRNVASPNDRLIYVCSLHSTVTYQVMLFGITQATYVVMFGNTFAHLPWGGAQYSHDISHDLFVISTLACLSGFRVCSHMPSLTCYNECVRGTHSW